MLEPRERVLLLLDFEAPLVREDFAAPPLARFAVEPVLEDLPALEERLDPEPEGLARVEALFLAAPLERDAVERELRVAPPVERFAVELDPEDLRAAPDRPALPRDPDAEEPEPELLPALALPSIDHLPLITRCAASATASAISEPSLVALAAMLLAACDAVSAASRPASRIFLRAPGLAAIAAAAAVNPAASISLLIAAFASLSTVLSLELEREREPEEDALEPDFEDVERELFRGDFAIFSLPASRERHFNAVPVPK